MKSRTKYRAIPTNGYASRKEAKRAAELKLLEKAGEIIELAEQVRFELIPKQDGERACHYVADFAYLKVGDFENPYQVEDCKGFKTEVYKIKKKLMLHVHGIRILET